MNIPVRHPGESKIALRPSLAETLDALTTTGDLARPEGDKIRCVACGHRCLLAPGRRGVCKVRVHADRQLRVPFGYIAGAACDPVEKKPFFHVFPGGDAFTFGMLGCDLHCGYCQNWVTSQALRDTAAQAPIHVVTAAELARMAQREGARLIVSSYNEPLITAEWSVAVFKAARQLGLPCAFVSNGNATPEVLDYLQTWISAYKVDLKTFQDRNYRALGGTLPTVLDTITSLHARGIWVEVLTLVVPGFNDSTEELRDIAQFVAGVSRDIPWHVTAFHPDYRMTGPRHTAASDLLRAVEIGAAVGLRYVYAGNLPRQVGAWEDTRCPSCQTTLVRRRGYSILEYAIRAGGKCPRCDQQIPGIWHAAPIPPSPAGASPRVPRRVQI